jgi:uncharacterized OB-fold protein
MSERASEPSTQPFDFGTVQPRLPDPEEPNAEFYRRARGGQLHLQHCPRCDGFQHPPRHGCRRCGGTELEWRPVEGVGTLYSWTVSHFPFDRGWSASLPYATGVVELPERVRLVAALPATVAPRTGLPVRVRLIPQGDDAVLLSLVSEGDD